MPEINKKDVEEKVNNIQKQIVAIEKERDLALKKIRKSVEARQIKKITDSLK